MVVGKSGKLNDIIPRSAKTAQKNQIKDIGVSRHGNRARYYPGTWGKIPFIPMIGHKFGPLS